MKLFLAILLSIGIAFGGCAGMTKNPGMTATIPNMKYVDVDFFRDGNITKVPSHIDANANVWIGSFRQLSENYGAATFKYQDEKMTWVIHTEDNKVLFVVYGKINKDTGKYDMEFYIYDGKPYPVVSTEEECQLYMERLYKQEDV